MSIAAGVLLATATVTTLSMREDSPERVEVERTDNERVEPSKVVSWELPETMTFAGETVPMDMIDVREKLDREMIVNTYWHSNAMLVMKRAHRWFPLIEAILEEEGLPEDFKYLAVIESGLANVKSPAGATGFWQFMKATGWKYNLEVTDQVDERYNVEKSTRAACAYLKNMYAKYGSWSLAAASYNVGPGRLDQRLEEQQVAAYWDLLLNAETGRYVYRILAVREMMQAPARYGFTLEGDDLYDPYETEDRMVDRSIPNLADWAIAEGINYKILKTLNPWLRAKSLTVTGGKSYVIKMPKDPSFRIH